MSEHIWNKGKKYYYFDTYATKEEAIITSKRIKKMTKANTFIIKEHGGLFVPETNYCVYTSKQL